MKNEAILFALFVGFLWGLAPVIHKSLLRKYTPITIMMIISAVNFLCILLYSLFNKKELVSDYNKITIKDIAIILITGATTMFLANVIYYNVLRDNKSYEVAALIDSGPVFALLLAYFFLSEKITFNGFLGVGFVMTGVYLISMNNCKYLP